MDNLLTLVNIISNFFLKFPVEVIVCISKIVASDNLRNLTVDKILMCNNNEISSLGFRYNGTICISFFPLIGFKMFLY